MSLQKCINNTTREIPFTPQKIKIEAYICKSSTDRIGTRGLV